MNVLAERVDFVKVRRLSAGYWVFFFFFNAMRSFDVNPLTSVLSIRKKWKCQILKNNFLQFFV